jgi:RNA polymerase-binding transcription factor DksA
MPNLTPADLERFQQQLEARRTVLEKEITQEYLRSESDSFQELAGRVHDSGEESLAEQLMSLNVTVAGKDLEELRDVEAALARIADRSYGRCLDCGQDIDPRRLALYPTAKRCTDCQSRREYLAKDRTPSL